MILSAALVSKIPSTSSGLMDLRQVKGELNLRQAGGERNKKRLPRFASPPFALSSSKGSSICAHPQISGATPSTCCLRIETLH